MSRPVSCRRGDGRLWVPICIVFILAAAGPAGAQLSTSQIPENRPPETPHQLGPFYLAPLLELKDVGEDSNVFNDSRKERDLTATPSATLLATSLFGPFRVATNLRVDYVWYQKFASERSVNTDVAVRAEAYLDRVRPWVSGGFSRTRERQGFEIDSRAQRQRPTLGAGVDWVLGSRTSVALSGQFERPRYADVATFAGVSLADQLNGDRASYRAGLLFDLTPLTTLRVGGERATASFDGGSVRDNDSWAVLPSLLFQPAAALSGEVMVGYRSLTPKNVALVGFQGVVAEGGLALTLLDITQVSIEGSRGIEYSFDELHPYYVQTGARLVITQKIGGPFEVGLIGGVYRLAFRDLPGDQDGPRGAERLTTAGVRVGYRLGDAMLLGIHGEFAKRRSTSRTNRDYDRTFYYASISYLL